MKPSVELPSLSPKKPTSRRKPILITVACIVAVGLIATGGVLLTRYLTRPTGISVAALLEKNPAMVGQYRYVNACQALPAEKYNEIFGYDKNNDHTDVDTHAEGSHTKQAETRSECDTNFGSISAPNGNPGLADSVGLVLFTMEQFPQASQATSLITADYRDKSNDQVTYDGVKVSMPQGESRTRFNFAYRNIYTTVDVSSSFKVFDESNTFTADKPYLRQVAAKLVPIVKAAIDNPTLSQVPMHSTDAGQRILGGKTATIINPCDYVTSADFKAVIGGDDDTTDVFSKIYIDSLNQAKYVKDAVAGRGSVECKRHGYIDAEEPSNSNKADAKAYLTALDSYQQIVYPTIDTEIFYFKDTNDALTNMKAKVATDTKLYPDLTSTPVVGLGDYAVLDRYTFNSSIINTSGVDPNRLKEYHLIGVSGSYGVDISIEYTPGPLAIDRSATHAASDDQYRKAAELLFARLPK